MEYLSFYPLRLPRKFLIIGASAAVFLSPRGSTRYWVTQVGERSAKVLLKSSYRSNRGVLVTSFLAGRFSEKISAIPVWRTSFQGSRSSTSNDLLAPDPQQNSLLLVPIIPRGRETRILQRHLNFGKERS